MKNTIIDDFLVFIKPYILTIIYLYTIKPSFLYHIINAFTLNLCTYSTNCPLNQFIVHLKPLFNAKALFFTKKWQRAKKVWLDAFRKGKGGKIRDAQQKDTIFGQPLLLCCSNLDVCPSSRGLC